MIYDSLGMKTVFMLQGLIGTLSALPVITIKPVKSEALSDIIDISFRQGVDENWRILVRVGSFISGLQLLRETRRFVLPVLANRAGYSV